MTIDSINDVHRDPAGEDWRAHAWAQMLNATGTHTSSKPAPLDTIGRTKRERKVNHIPPDTHPYKLMFNQRVQR